VNELEEWMPHISLRISNETPISTTDFAGVLKALGDDYSRLEPGRTLVIGSIREGSIVAALYDAMAVSAPFVKDVASVAQAGLALKSLVENIKKTVLATKQPVFLPPDIPQDVTQSVENMAKAAIDAKARCDLEYKDDKKGISLIVSISPADAGRVQTNVKKLKQQNRRAIKEVASRPAVLRAIKSPELPELTDAIRRPVQDQASGQHIIRLLVTALDNAGLLVSAHALVAELIQQGRDDWADLLRAEVASRTQT